MKKRILIVDAMAVFREPIAAALRARGYETSCASDGRAALGLLRGDRPDLVLLDVAMPAMDGFAYLQAINDDESLTHPPIILLTAVGEKADVLRAARLGVSDYLLKSQFSLEELFTRIERCLTENRSDTAASRLAPAAATTEGDDGASPGSSPIRPPEAKVASARSTGDPKQMMSAQDVKQHLQRHDRLKAFSPAVMNVLQLTQSEGSSSTSLANAIKQDPALVVRILNLANSTAYARREPVDTVDKAVTLMGLSQLRKVTLNIGVIDKFSDVVIGDIKTGEFWEHALACGVVAAELSRGRGHQEAERAFTVGLLHDIGRVLYAQDFRHEYATVLKTAGELQLPLETVEQDMLGLSHAEAVGEVLQSWRLPADLAHPIIMHHSSIEEIRALDPRRRIEVATVALADRLCHALILGCSGNETLYPTKGLCDLLEIEAEVLMSIEQTARRRTNDLTAELKYSMLIVSGDEGWIDSRDRYRQRLAGPVRPAFVSSAPEFDAIRIFLDQIAERDDQPPNLGVVHLDDLHDEAELSREYAATESASGGRVLPTIVLAPEGNLRLSPSIWRHREPELLPMPITITRLLQAINRCVDASSGEMAA